MPIYNIMLIEKIIEDNISLSTAELTSGDINNVIESKIRRKYEKRCWENVYIVRVLKIIKRSTIKMAVDRIDGQGDASAQFLVEALQFNAGDVLVGCKIIDVVKDSKIICERLDAVITFRDRFFISPKPGQILFMRVKRSSYLTNQEKASIYGMPYVIDTTKKVIFIPSDNVFYTDDQKMILAENIKRIDDAKTKLSKCDTKTVKFFEDMLYPYRGGSIKTTPKKVMSGGSSIVDAFDMATDIVSGKIKKSNQSALVTHPAVAASSTMVYQLPEAWTDKLIAQASGPDNKMYVMDKSHFDIILNILYEHIIYLNTVTDLCEVYSDSAIRKSHENIWESYERVKINETG